MTNSSNGERWQTTTSARGWYFIEYLSVGGPYRIEVRAVGYEPVRRDSIFLALGQRLTAHFSADTGRRPVTRDHGHRHGRPRFSVARTGPAQIIPDSTIARLPVGGRDYAELAVSPPRSPEPQRRALLHRPARPAQ